LKFAGLRSESNRCRSNTVRRRRLELEQLEDRCVPTASGVFFTDGNNQLHVLNAATGQFTNTGGFALQIAGGVDAAGNPEVFFTDGNNQLFRWVNGTFTNTGGFATRISAGHGMVAFTDGNNQVWTFSDAAGFHNTGAFALALSAGFDTAGNNLVSFLDGNNQLWTLNPATNVLTNTGGFGIQLGVGRDAQGGNQIYLIDGNGLLYRVHPGQFFATGVFPDAAGQLFGSQAQVYFEDAWCNLGLFNDFTGIASNPANFLQLTSSPGTADAYVTDVNNQIELFHNNQFTPTGAFALNISAF
jgi:hypothetical protein